MIRTRFIHSVPQEHVFSPLVPLDLESDIVTVLVRPSHIMHDPQSQFLSFVIPCIQLFEIAAYSSSTRNDMKDVVTEIFELPQVDGTRSKPGAT